ncbi:hypothetical protein [Sodaliphilus pleomorphus]|jgi:hypothetical protein|uniref:Uncharacterized protein n=1 Tax=Sodaliphilus pleomorphus TaxID=2606626 RepID=A0A6L5X8X1_9BACT|nr:hypothetical protein [Sodaliphilus pleomorphus]MSS16780.1 hypothetical protein [Sodaliphilus pleomorphus]
MDEEKYLDMDIADAIIERPQGFSVGNRHFYLYPVTLGKMYLLQRLMESLEVNRNVVMVNPYLEAIRLVHTKREDCCRLITYHTMRTKKEVFDHNLVEDRIKYLNDNADDEDLATILILLLTAEKTHIFMKHLGIAQESERYGKANSVKKDTGSVTFGGKSIYGSLLDYACERYGWTLDYVVWGISYVNLQLMIADSVKTLYLTKDEMHKAHITATDHDVIKAESPEAWERIKSMNWE